MAWTKMMPQDKAERTFWSMVRHHAENMPLYIACRVAHDEMRELYGIAFNKQTKLWVRSSRRADHD